MVSVDQNEEGDWTAYSPHCEYWSGQWWLSGAGDPVRSQESWIYFSCATSFLFTLSGLLHKWLCMQCIAQGQGCQLYRL